MIGDFDRRISEFEKLLQKMATEITSGVIFERLLPMDLWRKAEESVTTLRSLTERLTESMLVLKPEMTPTIERRFRAVLQPLDEFKEILFRKSDNPMENSRLALEQLRKAVMGASDLLQLAKGIRGDPSRGIMEVIRLKEVSKTKEYLASIPVPEVIHLRFINLRKQLENLRFHMSNLERALGETRMHIAMVQDELAKFRPSQPEGVTERPKVGVEAEKPEAEEEKVEEPTLLRKDKQSALPEF